MIVVNPHLEGGRAAEDLRIDLSPNVSPINGCALCQPVDAHALMCPRTRIRSRFPEPQDGSVPAFVHPTKPQLRAAACKRLPISMMPSVSAENHSQPGAPLCRYPV